MKIWQRAGLTAAALASAASLAVAGGHSAGATTASLAASGGRSAHVTAAYPPWYLWRSDANPSECVGASPGNGHELTMRPCNGADASQLWATTSSAEGTGWYRLVLYPGGSSGYCADDPHGVIDALDDVWACSVNNANEAFWPISQSGGTRWYEPNGASIAVYKVPVQTGSRLISYGSVTGNSIWSGP
jgi:hypothetical protein